jgi:hypothetical protein
MYMPAIKLMKTHFTHNYTHQNSVNIIQIRFDVKLGVLTEIHL